MKTGIIIQARMLSTRLPGKVLLPLEGKTVLEHVVERCRKVSRSSFTGVAATTRKEDDVLAETCEHLGIPVCRGSEDNVMERYYLAAQTWGIDTIVRITSDCPLIDPEIVDQVIALFQKENADVAANIVDRLYPRGFDTEVFKTKFLKELLDKKLEPFYLEHVTPYFYEHPEIYKTASLKAQPPLDRPDLRLCIDTAEDYDLLKKLFSQASKFPEFYAAEILQVFNENPQWKEINANVAHLKRGGKT